LPKGKRPRLVDPSVGLQDEKLLGAAARSYLHINCATCHRRGGGGTSKFELLAQKIEKDKYLIEAPPTQGTFGIFKAEVVSTIHPSRSVLLYRMAKLGRGRMPHFGSNVIDEDGLRLIFRWNESLFDRRSSWILSESGKTALRIFHGNHSLAGRLRRSVDASDERFRKFLHELLSFPDGALLLAIDLRTQRYPQSKRRRIIEIAASHPDAGVRDLFEPFLPEEQRIKRLGTVVDRAALMKMKGIAERGKVVFFRESTASCANCHKIGDKGKEVGPDLSHVAKKNTKSELLESILEPSKKIDPKFRVYVVQTLQGKLHTGLFVKRDATEIVLREATGKTIRITAGDAEVVAPQQKSLMPELLLRDMTPQEVADLLEFLQSLK
jgi:putative heme-binding domain-containing protein